MPGFIQSGRGISAVLCMRDLCSCAKIICLNRSTSESFIRNLETPRHS